MKKTYIKPSSLELSFRTEGMIAASLGVGSGDIDNSNQILTNKKEGEYWSTGMEGSEDYFESNW